MNIKRQHVTLLAVGAMTAVLILLGIVLPLSAARGVSVVNAPLAPAAPSDLVTLDSTYVGQAKLLYVVPGVFSDTLIPPTSTLDLGNIDLGFLLNCDQPQLSGYVDLSTTLVFTQEHVVTTTQAVTTPLAVGPAVSGTCAGSIVEFQSEPFNWVTGADQAVTRQFRLMGTQTAAGSLTGEYRETLWGYGPQPLTIVGNFEVWRLSGLEDNTYTLTPIAGAHGSVTPGTVQTVTYGSSLTFTVTPDVHYHTVDVGVDGVSQGPLASYVFTDVTANHTITAAFAINTFTITPTAEANGAITPGTPQTVNYGEAITFTVVANLGYHILDVGVDGTSQGAIGSYTFNNVTANHTITAAFAINTFTITPTAGANGSITPGTPQLVSYGDSITFTITPNAGYHILDVGVDGVSQGALSSYTFNSVAANHAITAAFASSCIPIAGLNFAFKPDVPLSGDSVVFTATVSAGTAPIAYTWNWGDATTAGSGANATHAFPLAATPQTYTVTLGASNACSSPAAVDHPVIVQPRRVYLPLVLK